MNLVMNNNYDNKKTIVKSSKFIKILTTYGTITFLGFNTMFLISKEEVEAKPLLDIVEEQSGKSINMSISIDKTKEKIVEILYEKEIRDFCELYSLEFEIIYEEIKQRTYNFKDDSFVNNNYIEGTVDYNEEHYYPSKEAGLLCFIRSVHKEPEKFNLIKEEINTNTKYQYNGYFEDIVQKYCEILDYNPVPVLSIAYTECGSNLNSNAFLEKNNPSGTMLNGKLAEFSSVSDGVIYTILNLKYNYHDYDDVDIDTFANKVSYKYCPEGTDNWVDNFTYYANLKEEDIYKNKKYIVDQSKTL